MTGRVARAASVGLLGVEGHLVTVEACVGRGLPGMTVVGLPDAAVVEARDRIRAAVLHTGEAWPLTRITVSLSPAWLRKHGSGFDLALALAVLAATGRVRPSALDGVVALGELGLDGTVRPVRGVLPAVLAARQEGIRTVLVPRANAAEAAAAPGVTACGVGSLAEAVAVLRDGVGRVSAPVTGGDVTCSCTPRDVGDLADVAGQSTGSRAVEVAAAGGHHLLLLGPPGAGKTMLAERLPGLLPALAEEFAVQASAVHSVAGCLPSGAGLLTRPPLQAPHHSCSVASMVGGGGGPVRAGSVSLAHRGVLLLDEAPEFGAATLDALRRPVESGSVLIARAAVRTSLPARFQLVMTANPCPCARPGGDAECDCAPGVRRRYLARLSGPLLDRVDLRVTVPSLTRAGIYDDLVRPDPSTTVRARVTAARAAAVERWQAHGVGTNAEVPGRVLRADRRVAPASRRSLDRALDRGEVSVRGYDRVLRVAWTVADLAGLDRPDVDAVETALGLRQGTSL